ncbi:MAG TPA: hypothetical protein VL860_01530 [Planctomycetota bacterium]|nr:hypothetical protein [Planctomycetota bacterium]
MLRRDCACKSMLALVLGVLATGCGEPAAPAPTPAPAPVVAPVPAPVVEKPKPASVLTPKEEVFSTITYGIERLKAKDYTWIFTQLLPSKDAEHFKSDPQALTEATQVFVEEKKDVTLLKAFESIKPEDIVMSDEGTKATVTKKEDWDVTHDMVFIKETGQWHLKN